jgi:hypothetical protein
MVAAFRLHEVPNSTAMALINAVSVTSVLVCLTNLSNCNIIHARPYCVRYMRMPEGAGLLDLHFQRMVDSDPIHSDDDYAMSVAETCQFLSTLLVLYPFTVPADDPRRQRLLEKLRGWRETYRGTFCEEVAQRCLDMLEPQDAQGEMAAMMSTMKARLEKGIESCNLEECNVKRDGNRKETLMQCARYVECLQCYLKI